MPESEYINAETSNVCSGCNTEISSGTMCSNCQAEYDALLYKLNTAEYWTCPECGSTFSAPNTPHNCK